MKRQRLLSFFSLRTLWDTPHFVFLVVMLLCGALAGSFTGLRSGQSEGALLEQLAHQMIEQAQAPGQVGVALCQAALGGFAWQIVTILCGAMRGHSLLISAVCAARGFVMAFAAGAFLSTLHLQGFLLALASGGVSAVFTVPCLLLTGTACFIGGQQAPRGRGGYWYALGRYRAAVILCTMVAVFGACLRVPLIVMLAHLAR